MYMKMVVISPPLALSIFRLYDRVKDPETKATVNGRETGPKRSTAARMRVKWKMCSKSASDGMQMRAGTGNMKRGTASRA